MAVGPGSVADLAWKIVGAGDFNADGETDIIWQHDTGTFAVWLMRGSALLEGRVLQPNQVDPRWRVAAVTDLDGDGSPDLIWRHTGDGSVAVWYMNGLTMRQGRLLDPGSVPDQSWTIAGAGDFNADGRNDILWQHRTTGVLAAWLMNGHRQVAGVYLTPDRVADLNWRIVAVVDVNGDFRADVIWQHTNGQLSAWVMNGTTMGGGMGLNPGQVSDTAWRIVAGR
jgi:hypothetical protein